MADIDRTQVGERIRERRIALGLSQKDVAEPDYTAAYVSLVESGARRPSTEAIEHIAAKLDTDSGYLLHGHPEAVEGRLALALQRVRLEARNGDPRKARKQLDELRAETRRYGFRLLEAKSLEYLGSLEERSDDLDAASLSFERALKLYGDQPSHLRFAAVAGAARCASLRGQVRYAIHILEDYLLELQRDGLEDPAALMRTYSGLVSAYTHAGLRKEAGDAAERALSLGGQVTDPEQIACMNMNVAANLLESGLVDEALRASGRAEAAFDSLGWRHEVAICQHNRGVIQTEKGEFDDARTSLRDALKTLSQGSSADEIAAVHVDLAKLERLAGDADAARDQLGHAENHLARANPRTVAEYRLELALQCDEPVEAEGGLLGAADAFLAAELGSEATAALTLLGDARHSRGDHEGAAQAYRRALELRGGV